MVSKLSIFLVTLICFWFMLLFIRWILSFISNCLVIILKVWFICVIEFDFVYREVGVKVRNMDVTSGEIIINLDESLFVKSKAKPGFFDRNDLSGGSNPESLSIKRPQKDEKSYLSLKKHALVFPDKVCGSYPVKSFNLFIINYCLIQPFICKNMPTIMLSFIKFDAYLKAWKLDNTKLFSYNICILYCLKLRHCQVSMHAAGSDCVHICDEWEAH